MSALLDFLSNAEKNRFAGKINLVNYTSSGILTYYSTNITMKMAAQAGRI
jgi:hypothetical protein